MGTIDQLYRDYASETIYLIPDNDEGRLIYVWSDDPAPSEHHVRDEAVEYIRKDIHDAHSDMLEHRGDELQMMLAAVEKERNTARRDYEVMNKLREAAEQERDEWKQQAEAEAIVADSYRDERDAALEREQALAAHVEAAKQLADSDRLDDEFYDEDGDLRTGKGWKSKLGRDLHSVLKNTPANTVTKRDLIKQAEALEHRADCIMAEAGYLENFRREVAGILRNDAKDKRQQAAAL